MPEAQLRGLDREYETIYVLSPDIDREGAEKISTRVSEIVSREGGKLTLVESWGRRRLAYPVQKHKRGVYVYLKYVGRGTIVRELERQLKMLDTVLKYQTVKVNDGVFAEHYEVKEDQLQYQHIEADEEEQDESKARILGLEDPRPDRDRGEGPGAEPKAEARGEGDADSVEDDVDLDGDELSQKGNKDEEESP
jgi:small subunit ribosomal protein S6